MDTPQWASAVIAAMQAKSDERYQDDLKVWQQAAAEWVTNAVHDRDDLKIPVPPFTTPIPVRQVWKFNGTMVDAEPAPPDPNIHMPVLPDPLPVSPATPFTTGGESRDQANQQMLAMVVQLLLAIKQKLGA